MEDGCYWRMVVIGGSSNKSIKLNNLVQVLNKAEESTLTTSLDSRCRLGRFTWTFFAIVFSPISCVAKETIPAFCAVETSCVV